MEWAPIGPQLASPVGPHVEYYVDVWGKLGLGFRAVCWVWSGPQMGPSEQAQLGPTSDIACMCGLSWAWFLGCLLGMGVGPKWASASKPCWAPRRILCGFVG